MMEKKRKKKEENEKEVEDIIKERKKDERSEIKGKAKVEINNVNEEIQDILEGCIKCGMCKSLCPVFSVLREEAKSPRGHAIMLCCKEVEDVLFLCNLCKACEKKCPAGVKLCDAIRKGREILNLKGKETKENKEMMKNIRETGNPFGKNCDLDKLYCC